MVQYFWWATLALLLGSAVTFLAMIPVYLIAGEAGLSNPYLVYFFEPLIMLWVSVRVGLKLPAIALGKFELTFSQSWHATTGRSIQILVVCLLLTSVNIDRLFIAADSDWTNPIVNLGYDFAINLFVGWPTMMCLGSAF